MKWPFVAGRYPVHWFLRFALLQLELSLSKNCHDGVIHYLQGNWGSFLDLTKVTLILKLQASLKFQLFFKVAKAVCDPESHLDRAKYKILWSQSSLSRYARVTRTPGLSGRQHVPVPLNQRRLEELDR